MITEQNIIQILNQEIEGREVVAPNQEWAIMWDEFLYIGNDIITNDSYLSKDIMQWFINNQPEVSQQALNELAWLSAEECAIYLKYYYNQNVGE